jgi:hypothetical protein
MTIILGFLLIIVVVFREFREPGSCREGRTARRAQIIPGSRPASTRRARPGDVRVDRGERNGRVPGLYVDRYYPAFAG